MKTKGSGGTEGGFGMFLLGSVLALTALYFLFDSVRVEQGGGGAISGMMGRRGGGAGLWETTSMGIVFLPLVIGVIALFYNASKKWAWVMLYIGVAILLIEVLSRIRFMMNMKTSHLLIMLVTFSAGIGLILRSYREEKRADAANSASEPPPDGVA